MQNATTKILATIVVLLSITLLVGNRLGATWAGGDGIVERGEISDIVFFGADCYVPSNDSQREHAITCPDQYLRFHFADTTFALDENTDVSIIQNDVKNPVVNLLTGRAVIRGNMTVVTRNIKIHINGTATLVHYSWQNIIDVLVLDGTATIEQGNAASSTITTGNAVHIDTLPPYDAISPTTLDIAGENVKAFYEWAIPQIPVASSESTRL